MRKMKRSTEKVKALKEKKKENEKLKKQIELLQKENDLLRNSLPSSEVAPPQPKPRLPRKTIPTPKPKPRTKVVNTTLKSDEQASSSSNQTRLDENEYQLPYLSPSIEGVNIEYFTNAYMSDVFNFIRNILSSNNQTVDICGYCSNRMRGKEYNNVKGFVSLSAFENYRNAFNTSSDETEYKYNGYVRYGEDEFKRLRRSKHGKGENFKFEIKEYIGKNCYIPTAGNCFIKCYLYQETKKMADLTLDEIIKQYGLIYFNTNNNNNIDSTDKVDNTIDDVMLCKYHNVYTKNEQYALVARGNGKCGYKEILSIINKANYKGQKYEGVNCYIPNIVTSPNSEIQSLKDVVCKVITQRYKTFLFKNIGDLRGGIMTYSKVDPLNKFMNTNITYYNSKDRHTYPKKTINDDPMIHYLYKNHFCLINKNKKAAGIRELEQNYHKQIKYTRCNKDNIKETSQFSINTKLTDAKVFVWDIETFADGVDRWSKTYAVALIPLDAIKTILGDKLNCVDSVDDETLAKLKSETKIFSGSELHPITDMIKYLGEQNFENVILIAHNAKGFDNWVFLSESGIAPYQMLKTGSGIVDMKIKNPYTNQETQEI
jgi:hypothetical protein